MEPTEIMTKILQPTQIWYSWNGANQEIFNAIYGKGINWATPYFYILEFIGNYKNIAYYAVLVAAIAGWNLLYRAITKNKIDGYFIRSQVAWILSFVLGFLAVAAIVGFLKEFSAFPRPFEAMTNVKLLYGGLHDVTAMHSFPSGHAAFTAFLMVALWSRFFGLLRFGLLLLLIVMCWYRVVVGFHYPADVVYGALIGLISTGIVRNIMCKMFKVWR